MIRKLSTIVVICSLLFGCSSGQGKQQSGFRIIENQQGDAANPNDMVTIFVGAHDNMMNQLGDIKASNQQVMNQLGEVKSSNQQVMGELAQIKATQKDALETAQQSLALIEDMSKRQGTGELTVFFPTSSAMIDKGSLEFERLVRFADFLARESRGRKLIFLAIGSASATGSKKRNMKLAKRRSEAPLEILGKYLVNIPHEFYRVYGTGDLYSPKGVRLKEHQRYQHTRIIALFDTSQAPAINEEVAAAAR